MSGTLPPTQWPYGYRPTPTEWDNAFSVVSASVATIAALRAATYLTLGQSQCYVLGYYVSSDGGEGTFVYNPSDIMSADNGGTIIVDGVGRRWYRNTNGQPVSVKAFGCYGNGTTDDTAAFQAALTAGAGNFPVLVPPYATLNVSSASSLPAKTDLIINGTIQKAAQSSGNYFNVLSIAGSSGKISGIGTIDGNKANQSGTQAGGAFACGLATTYGSNPPSQSSLYTDWLVSGITIENCVNQPISVAWAYSTARDCLFQTSGNSAQFAYSLRSDFVNCRAINISDDGMGFYLGNEECSMIGCTVSGCTTGMFILTDSVAPTAANVRCRIIGCTASGNTTAGVFIAGQSAGYSDGHTISGNTLANNGEAGNFDISYLSDCTFSGNVSLNSVGSVVNAAVGGGVNRVTFTGNILQGNGSNIVKVQGDLASGNTALSFVGNTLFDLTVGGSVGFALFCTGSSGYISLINNTFSATITTPFSDQSATKAALFDGSITDDNGSNVKQMSQSLNFVNNTGTVTIGLNEPAGQGQFTGQLNAYAIGATSNITGGGLITSGTTSTGALSVTSGGAIAFGPSTTLGFYGTSPQTQPTVSGSRASGAALASLLTELASLGIVVNSTTN